MKVKRKLLLGMSILGLGWGVQSQAQETFLDRLFKSPKKEIRNSFDFDKQKQISPQAEPQSREAALKQKYYKKYLAEYRYRSPQHRIFYQNGY